MISITRIYEFEAAHFLGNHKGKCHNLHGHSYKAEITLSRSDGIVTDDESEHYGMVLDFGSLDDIVVPILNKYFDHKNLNESIRRENWAFYPTAERIALLLADFVQKGLDDTEDLENCNVDKVVIWETSRSYATWVRS